MNRLSPFISVVGTLLFTSAFAAPTLPNHDRSNDDYDATQALATLEKTQSESVRTAILQDALDVQSPGRDRVLSHWMGDASMMGLLGPEHTERLWQTRGLHNDQILLETLNRCCSDSVRALAASDEASLVATFITPLDAPPTASRIREESAALYRLAALEDVHQIDESALLEAWTTAIRIEAAVLPPLTLQLERLDGPLDVPEHPPHHLLGACGLTNGLRLKLQNHEELAVRAGRLCADPRRGPAGLTAAASLCFLSGTEGCLSLLDLRDSWPRSESPSRAEAKTVARRLANAIADGDSEERIAKYRTSLEAVLEEADVWKAQIAGLQSSQFWLVESLWPTAPTPWDPDRCAISIEFGSHGPGADLTSRPLIEGHVERTQWLRMGAIRHMGREGELSMCLHAEDQATALREFQIVLDLIPAPASHSPITVTSFDGRIGRP